MFHPFPFELFYSFFQRESFYIFFETIVEDQLRSQSYLFYRPEIVLSFRKKDSWEETVSQLLTWQKKGYFIAIIAEYELGLVFEDIVSHCEKTSEENDDEQNPLFTAVACLNPLIFNHCSGQFSFDPKSLIDDAELFLQENAFWIKNFHFKISQEAYSQKIDRIKEAFLQGKIYQMNLTDIFQADFEGSPLSFYEALRKQQSVGYACVVKSGKDFILSLSPELFLRGNKKGKILMKPMKGTAPRGCDRKEDLKWKNFLKMDSKNRSENIMIVDLLRNDLGRVCREGSLKVDRLCDVTGYQTVWQMTSTLWGFKRKEISIWDVFRSVFPSGSITGAPKIASMEMIAEIENQKRGLYTGALGYVTPTGKTTLSVPIRTISLSGNNLQMGVGSGIVFESEAQNEYEECLLKCAFIKKTLPQFSLIETLCWKEGRYQFLEAHLDRLNKTAQHFSFLCDLLKVKEVLKYLSQEFVDQMSYKVRLKMNSDGIVRCRSFQIKPLSTQPLRVGISSFKLDSKNPFLYHKTTCRSMYRQELLRIRKEKQCFDLLFFNENELLCEGSISNVYIQKGEDIFTPFVSCGLLNGIYRQHLMKTRKTIKEKNLFFEDLLHCDAFYLSNSVIGFKEAVLVS